MSDSEDDYWGDEIEGAGEWKGEKKRNTVRKLGSEYRCTANRACFMLKYLYYLNSVKVIYYFKF